LLDHVNEALRWILLLPLIGALVSGLWLIFARHELPRSAVIGLGCGAPILSFIISVRQVFRLATEFPAGERVFRDNLYTWISAGDFHAELAFLLDPLSAVMILVVTGVGSLIHVYSIGYMDSDHRDDRGYQRFFCYLNLFTFAMLMLVLGDNLLVLFVGWEGVGFCSYILIGFWYLDDHNAMCGQKAFIVNRIGDFGFLLGIFLLFWAFFQAGHPTIEFTAMREHVGAIADRRITLPDWLGFLPGFPTWTLLTLAGLCFFTGACGKSAQLPLYVWLPDAMAGPTPVSALIHAATMVTAGVYMVCRLSFLYSLAPGALATVAWVGGLTALFAATIGVCQKDIKKVLAYSTVSQLGYMFMAAGVASYSAAIFHLMTHAFFKALLFLGAGAVILGMHHEQNIDLMGGLRRRMPWTHWTFLVAVLAISGVPPLSGFFSKDEILLGANLSHDIPGHTALWVIGLVTAGITAFYMFRLYFLTFTGECRAPIGIRSHIREQPAVVVVPLAILAALAIVGGLVGFPDAYGDMLFSLHRSNSLHYFLQESAASAHHEVSHSHEFALAALAVLVASAGIGAAAVLYYYRTDLVPRVTAVLRPLYQLIWRKYYVDELYNRTIVRPLVRVSDAFLYRTFDVGVIDRIGVDGTAGFVRGIADRGLKLLQTGLTQSYVFVMLVGGLVLVAYLVGGF
jgi:NADH-quinone oxidoreductase subunit L